MFPLALLVVGIPSAFGAASAAEIESAYWSMEMKYSVSPFGGSGLNKVEDRLFLFKNGVAVRGFHREGVDALDMAQVKADTKDDHFGRWTKSSKTLTLKWGGGSSQKLTADGSNFTDGGLTWRPLKRIDGVPLNGRFAAGDPSWEGTSQIMFLPDGNFAFRNVRKAISDMDLTAKLPEHGAGTYELRNWTLYLTFSNGQKANFSFELPMSEDAKAPTFVTLATKTYSREPGELPIPKREKVGALELFVPEGWGKGEPKNGMATLNVPGLPANVDCSVTILPAQDYPGQSKDWHDAIWSGMIRDSKVSSFVEKDKVGAFIRSMARLDRADGSVAWFSVYSTVSKGKAYVAMFMSTHEELFRTQLKGVDAMIAGAAIAP